MQDDSLLGLPLLLMRARHYSPELGRFIQPDPDALEDNHYAYATNNPVTKVGPDGKFAFLTAIVVVVRVAVVAVKWEAKDCRWPGREISCGNVVRIAPFGSRSGPWQARLPQYHRRPGIGWHRPWQRGP